MCCVTFWFPGGIGCIPSVSFFIICDTFFGFNHFLQGHFKKPRMRMESRRYRTTTTIRITVDQQWSTATALSVHLRICTNAITHTGKTTTNLMSSPFRLTLLCMYILFIFQGNIPSLYLSFSCSQFWMSYHCYISNYLQDQKKNENNTLCVCVCFGEVPLKGGFIIIIFLQ